MTHLLVTRVLAEDVCARNAALIGKLRRLVRNLSTSEPLHQRTRVIVPVSQSKLHPYRKICITGVDLLMPDGRSGERTRSFPKQLIRKTTDLWKITDHDSPIGNKSASRGCVREKCSFDRETTETSQEPVNLRAASPTDSCHRASLAVQTPSVSENLHHRRGSLDARWQERREDQIFSKTAHQKDNRFVENNCPEKSKLPPRFRKLQERRDRSGSDDRHGGRVNRYRPNERSRRHTERQQQQQQQANHHLTSTEGPRDPNCVSDRHWESSEYRGKARSSRDNANYSKNTTKSIIYSWHFKESAADTKDDFNERRQFREYNVDPRSSGQDNKKWDTAPGANRKVSDEGHRRNDSPHGTSHDSPQGYPASHDSAHGYLTSHDSPHGYSTSHDSPHRYSTLHDSPHGYPTSHDNLHEYEISQDSPHGNPSHDSPHGLGNGDNWECVVESKLGVQQQGEDREYSMLSDPYTNGTGKPRRWSDWHTDAENRTLKMKSDWHESVENNSPKLKCDLCEYNEGRKSEGDDWGLAAQVIAPRINDDAHQQGTENISDLQGDLQRDANPGDLQSDFGRSDSAEGTASFAVRREDWDEGDPYSKIVEIVKETSEENLVSSIDDIHALISKGGWCPRGKLQPCIQALAEWAIENSSPEIPVKIISSFNENEEFGGVVTAVIQSLPSTYTKPQSGGEKKHVDYAEFLGHVCLQARQWHGNVNGAVVNTVAKWAVFNKHKQHPRPGHLYELYADCLFSFLRIAGPYLEEFRSDDMATILDGIKGKLLDSSISQSVREKHLSIIEARYDHLIKKKDETITRLQRVVERISNTSHQPEERQCDDNGTQTRVSTRDVGTDMAWVSTERPGDAYHGVRTMLQQLSLTHLLSVFDDNGIRDNVLEQDWTDVKQLLKECGIKAGQVLEIKTYLARRHEGCGTRRESSVDSFPSIHSSPSSYSTKADVTDSSNQSNLFYPIDSQSNSPAKAQPSFLMAVDIQARKECNARVRGQAVIEGQGRLDTSRPNSEFAHPEIPRGVLYPAVRQSKLRPASQGIPARQNYPYTQELATNQINKVQQPTQFNARGDFVSHCKTKQQEMLEDSFAPSYVLKQLSRESEENHLPSGKANESMFVYAYDESGGGEPRECRSLELFSRPPVVQRTPSSDGDGGCGKRLEPRDSGDADGNQPSVRPNKYSIGGIKHLVSDWLSQNDKQQTSSVSFTPNTSQHSHRGSHTSWRTPPAEQISLRFHDQMPNSEQSGTDRSKEDRELSGYTCNRDEDRELSGYTCNRDEDRELSGYTCNRDEDRELSGYMCNRDEDRELSGYTCNRDEDRELSGYMCNRDEDRELYGYTCNPEDRELPGYTYNPEKNRELPEYTCNPKEYPSLREASAVFKKPVTSSERKASQNAGEPETMVEKYQQRYRARYNITDEAQARQAAHRFGSKARVCSWCGSAEHHSDSCPRKSQNFFF